MRKVYVTLNVQLIIEVEEGIEINEVINEMEYDFTSKTEDAVIVDSSIEGDEVTDSK